MEKRSGFAWQQRQDEGVEILRFAQEDNVSAAGKTIMIQAGVLGEQQVRET